MLQFHKSRIFVSDLWQINHDKIPVFPNWSMSMVLAWSNLNNACQVLCEEKHVKNFI